MSSPRPRITQLDGLRGCAIAAVFLHHAYEVKLLWMGVDLFFVLSGFLITGILMSHKERSFGSYIGHFYSRRVKRILPPYVILLVVCAIAFHGPWMRYWFLYLGGMNFLRPLDLPRLNFLSPLWSLAVEEQFYLVWPIAVFFLSRKQVIRCAVAMLVLAPVLRFACTPLFRSEFAVYMLLPFRMDTLAAGALLALFWPELRKLVENSPGLRTKIAWGCAGVFVLALAAIVLLQRHGDSTYRNTRLGNFGIYEATLSMMASAFVVVLLGVGRKWLSGWPLVWLGTISYSFYLIHLVMLHVLPQFHGLLALAASLAYAGVSWFVVERPILGVGRKERSAVMVPVAGG